MTVRRLTNAAPDFALGVFTAPIALITWPFFLAWYVYNETDGYDL